MNESKIRFNIFRIRNFYFLKNITNTILKRNIKLINKGTAEIRVR